MNLKRYLVQGVIGLVVLLALPVLAEDTSTDRDPAVMAQRWLGWSGGPSIPPPAPAYSVGDTAQFWVSKAGRSAPTQITATLAAQVAFLDLWVEEGLPYTDGTLQNLANRMMFAYLIYRDRANQGGITTVPQSIDDVENADKLRFADIDGDESLTVLFARDLNTTRNILYNPVNNQAAALTANGWTNERGMIMVNTSASPALELSDLTYFTLVARAINSIIIEQNNPGQAAWLREAQSWYMLLDFLGADIDGSDFQTFFNTPDLPLTSTDTERSAITAAGQIFVRYVQQRFGADVLREWFTASGSGLDQLTAILAERGVTDLVTDEAITGQDVFADFVMANALNLPIGDTRFYYTHPGATDRRAATPGVQDQFDFQLPGQRVSQYGTYYVAFGASQAAAFQLGFEGVPVVPRLPMLTGEGNHFYWSGNGLYQNTSISRTVDLTGVSTASLTFDAWHQLSDGWNYGYVSVSEDGGATYKPLVSSGVTTTNPFGLSYGPGFTGVSNPEPSRPFPYLGIGLEANGITISSIAENSPLQGTAVQIGDTIAGHDGQLWQGKADLTELLSAYQPGDIVSLYIQRGDELFSVDVTLGTHPSRTVPANPIWTAQDVNLTPYAGKQIILRFDYVSADDKPDKGIAIDNIAIPEIGFQDDAESGIQGWQFNGWQQIDNVVPQSYVVQYALIGQDSATSRVVRLIGPQDEATAGTWVFSMNANDTLLIAISGLNDATDLPATFNLTVQSLSATPSSEATAESTSAP